MQGKKLLYIVRYPADENFNLKGKFDGQLKAFKNLNLDVYYITFDRRYFYLMHNGERTKLGRANGNLPGYFHTKVYYDLHKAVLLALDTVEFDYVYWRAAPVWKSSYTVSKKLREKGIKILYEIPTYCKDGEEPMSLPRKLFALYSKLWEDKVFKNVDLVVMIFTGDAVMDTFRGKPVAIIDNGVDIDVAPLRKPLADKEDIHILALASMSYWHGYDRLIRSLKQYDGAKDVILHMVGGNDGGMLDKWKKLAADLGVSDRVIFHGKLYGEELSAMFDLCDVGANALAQFRKNLNATSELKVREYTARGLPFLCSVEDPALASAEEVFWLKVANDDSVPDMKEIVAFAEKMNRDKELPAKMREYAKEHMTWESQYRPIFEMMEKR